MGYFSNGTEGMIYQERWCDRCIHSSAGCYVWLAHLLYAYELCNEKDSPGKKILDLLIPRSKDGLSNNKCTMFKARPGKTDPDDGEPLLFERHQIGGAPVEIKETA